MARILIDLPDTFVFQTELPIYIQHINYGNHLDNAQVLALASEARVRFFRSLGYRELDVEGVGIVVADAAVQYKSEVFYGEVLVFDLAPAEFGKCGFDLMWRARKRPAAGRWPGARPASFSWTTPPAAWPAPRRVSCGASFRRVR